MKDHIATMKVAIQRKNAAMEECTDLLMLGDTVYAVGKTHDGYANWAIASHDSSSYWGHYGFTTRQGALDDMVQRSAGKVR